MSGTVRQWNATDVIFEAFWRILQASRHPKLAKRGLKCAPQRRGYTRSVPMGPIDGTHGCPQKTVFSLSTRASVRASGRNGLPRRSFFEAFLSILRAFWHPKLAKSGLKCAPQRRGYTRSVPMGPIDGTHGCPQKTVFSLSTRASVRAPGR
eukprot:gene16286-biopygen20261